MTDSLFLVQEKSTVDRPEVGIENSGLIQFPRNLRRFRTCEQVSCSQTGIPASGFLVASLQTD